MDTVLAEIWKQVAPILALVVSMLVIQALRQLTAAAKAKADKARAEGKVAEALVLDVLGGATVAATTEWAAKVSRGGGPVPDGTEKLAHAKRLLPVGIADVDAERAIHAALARTAGAGATGDLALGVPDYSIAVAVVSGASVEPLAPAVTAPGAVAAPFLLLCLAVALSGCGAAWPKACRVDDVGEIGCACSTIRETRTRKRAGGVVLRYKCDGEPIPFAIHGAALAADTTATGVE